MALVLAAGVGQIHAQNPATTVTVDANANQHPINPNVYGVGMFMDSNDNVLPADLAAVNAPIHRFGGDLNSTYNWQLDAWNLSHDWYWESYLLSSPMVEGAFADSFIANTRAANVGTEPVITIPMLGYIAKTGPNATTGAASLWSYSIAKYGAQTGADPWQPDAGNGISAATGQPILTNDPTIAYVANSVATQQGWLQHLIAKWGASTTSTGVKYYMLDNEPSIWSGTHQDVHPKPETYDELYNAIVTYAGAIRAADPNAKIIGPEEWSWWAMWESGHDQANGTGAGSDYATHNNTYYYPWLLQQLYKYEQTTGIQLIDMLSVHCYNTIPGGGDDAASQQVRNRQTRMLWDPTFVDSGDWQTSSGLNNGIEEYIPLMKSWVSQYYPGLEIGCTEYNWGDDAALNGATTQADILGIYGAYGFDMAAIYGVPAYPTLLSFEIYRNYDGKLSTFGNTSVSDTVANPDNLSSFAALRSTDGALTVMVINKQTGSTPVTISLANFSSTGTAQAYQISSATQTKINQLANVTVANNAISTTVPSQSITLFVIPAGAVTTKPTAPTGLAATVGNGSVTLTWNAGGGATSYTVQRGTTSGGPYTAIGTVTSPSPTTFTNTGLTNGTTYYYVVSGTNSIGTGPNSTEVAATPMIVPVFTSSATASPNPVNQNASTTITATVTCTASTLTGGSVQVTALDPSGNTATTKTFTAQNFTTGQSQTYTLALTPTLAGTYTVEVAVLSGTGQQFGLNASAGTVTVNSSLTWTSSATASPASIAAGATTTISATVTDTGSGGLTNANVLINVYPAGSTTAAGSQTYSSQNFTAGGALKYSFAWTPASTVTPGTYTVQIGVFDSTWSTDYYWNGNAATITITGGTAPVFSSSAAASPTSIAAGATSAISASITDTGGALTNGNVLINVYPAGSTTAVGSQTFSSQNFAAGQTLKYTSNWTPASTVPAGTYTVQIGVFDSTWSTDYYWNNNAATITVSGGTSPAFTSSATAKPTSIAVGATSTISASVTDTGGALTNGNVLINVYPAGSTTAVGSQTFSAQNFAAGQTLKYTSNWTPASTVPAGTYTVEIGVFDSTWSTDYYWNGNAATITVTGGTAPAAPTGLTAAAGNGSVALSWTAPTGGVASYNIYRATTAGGESTTPTFTGITTTSYTDTGLTNGTKYYYKVAGVNTSGTGAMSTEASATPEPAPPSAPTGLTAAPGNASVALSWTAASGATTYNIFRATTAGGESTTPTVTGIATTSYTDTGLTNGTKYYYKVAAVNAGGTSALSTEASATPQAPAPASIAATAGGGQTAQVNTTFIMALQATVKDAGGNPVSGAAVTFTAPGSGASGKFGAAVSATATTNAQGVATAPAFTANATAGSYSVTASVSGVASTASFALTNTAASSATQVTNASAVYSPASQSVNLAATVSSASAPMTGGSVAFSVTGLGTATATVSNGQAVAALQIPAGSGAGTYAVSASYSGDAAAGSSSGSGVLTIAKANPVLTWNAPAAIVSGTALGAAQLDATANVAGAFVYSPPAGTVLPVGNNQQLQVTFTPANGPDYNPATKTVTIDVTSAAGTVKLAATFKLTRDPATKDVIVNLTVTNSGTSAAADVEVTNLTIGRMPASGLPLTMGAIAAGKSATVDVRFPWWVGEPGADHLLTVGGTYTGGQFETQTRVALP
jgi:ABC-type uncharacterized transport system substrate-binding protein